MVSEAKKLSKCQERNRHRKFSSHRYKVKSLANLDEQTFKCFEKSLVLRNHYFDDSLREYTNSNINAQVERPIFDYMCL